MGESTLKPPLGILCKILRKIDVWALQIFFYRNRITVHSHLCRFLPYAEKASLDPKVEFRE